MPTFDKRIEINAAGNLFLEIDLPGNEGQEVESGKRGSISNKVIVLIVIGIVSLVGAILFLVFFKHYANNRRAEGVVRSDFNDQSIHLHMISRGGNSFSIEVLRGATNNFAEDKIIGRGGCGLVYKGDLPDDSEIAIKKMDFRVMEARGLNEYQAEIDVLTRVRHRHLVALLGYCIDGHERFLVYEYMRQGTLSQHLFGFQQHGYSPLTWKQRIIIALDVGRGIEYLHSLTQQSFIHRDLKPSNILLDDNLRAKVADFGLVKKAPEGQSSVETQLAGTFGYLAPEYAETGRVTTKVDIYALGVILMELITGRKAIDNSLGEERCHLVTWFRQVMHNEENIQNEIDRTLNLDEETMSSIAKVAELAVHCTALQRHHRPDMG